jgi:hypothetical protein
MPDLHVEQTKTRCRDCHIEIQPTVFFDKDTKCQDLKEVNKSDTLNSHWLFVDDRLNVVEVGRGRRDLIPKHHCRHHLVDDTRN